MSIYLKVKIKSLAFEAKEIRAQERKASDNHRLRVRMRRAIQFKSQSTGIENVREVLSPEQVARLEKRLARSKARVLEGKGGVFWSLRNHRTNVVRQEARSTFIAYGFLRGVPYKSIEDTNKPVDMERVQALVAKYGKEDRRILMQRLEEWLNG